MKNNTIDVYVDFKSPYAFLAIEPSINFAKENKLGLWQGKFMNPEKWRKLN